MPTSYENVNPKIYEKSENRELTVEEEDELISDEIDCREVFDLLRNVSGLFFSIVLWKWNLNEFVILKVNFFHFPDPEYPLTLEELNVVSQNHIKVINETNEVVVNFTPTVPHCSMATLIGLSLRVQLLRALPSRYKVDICITPGSHASETAVNKQLNDKERVAAALENPHLTEVINHCIGKTLL